jgi:hypothetical protein
MRVSAKAVKSSNLSFCCFPLASRWSRIREEHGVLPKELEYSVNDRISLGATHKEN